MSERGFKVGDIVVGTDAGIRQDPWLRGGTTWLVKSVNTVTERLALVDVHSRHGHVDRVPYAHVRRVDLPDALERDVLEEWLDAE